MIPDKRQAQLVGSGGFNSLPQTFWDSVADVEPKGSTAMSRICIISPVRALTISQYIFSKRGAWFLQWDGTGKYKIQLFDGTGWRAALLTPTIIPQKGECIVWCGSYNETSLINYAKGESAVTGPYAGFTPSGNNLLIGHSSGVSQARDFLVLACLATDTYALSVEQMALADVAIQTMLNQGQEIDVSKLPGSGWLWRWDARNIHREKKGEWKDDISNVILSEVGETQLHAVQARF